MSDSEHDNASSPSQNPPPSSSQASHVARAPQTAGGASGEASILATSATTVTLTETSRQPPAEDEVLPLSLRARPSVRWAEGVRDNEGLGRKSSKRCCIFHKQRAFGESSTDSSDYDSDRSGSSSASGGTGGEDGEKKIQAKKHKRKIARPKKGKKVPDYQRYHA